MKPFERLWESFRDECLPANATDLQVHDMRYGFFSGAIASYKLTQEAGAMCNTGNPVIRAHGLALVNAFIAEIDAFHLSEEKLRAKKFFEEDKTSAALPVAIEQERANFLATLDRLERIPIKTEPEAHLRGLIATICLLQTLPRETFSIEEWRTLSQRVLAPTMPATDKLQ